VYFFFIFICIYVVVDVFVSVSVYVHVYVHVYVYLYAKLYVCICVYVYKLHDRGEEDDDVSWHTFLFFQEKYFTTHLYIQICGKILFKNVW
jgi:hypothetical protein